MKHWWCVLALLAVAACSHMDKRGSAFGCGIPIMTDGPIGGRIEIDKQLASRIQRQLPGSITVDDGCWEQMPDGHLEGTYNAQKTETGYVYNVNVYVFEYRNGTWLLANTRHELQLSEQHR